MKSEETLVANEAHRLNKERQAIADRETRRKAEVAQLIKTVTTTPNNTHEYAEGEAQVAIAHKAYENAFFVSLGVTNPDIWRDDVPVQANMPALRRLARQYANDRIYEAAEARRTASLRRELIDMADAQFEALIARSIETLRSLGADYVKTSVKVNSDISKKVK